MFNEKDFIMNTIKSMYDNEPEYKVRQYVSNWYDKGVLTLDDLHEVDTYYLEKMNEIIMTTEEPVK